MLGDVLDVDGRGDLEVLAVREVDGLLDRWTVKRRPLVTVTKPRGSPWTMVRFSVTFGLGWAVSVFLRIAPVTWVEPWSS